MLNPQFFFDVVVNIIEDSDSGYLDHLASWIVANIAIILPVQYKQRLLIRPSIDDFTKAISYNLVRHVGIISFDVAFEDVTRIPMLPVISFQKASKPVSR